MKTIKLLLWCAICVVIGLILARWIFGQGAASFDVEKPMDGQPSRILVSGGVSGTWLEIKRANTHQGNPAGKGGFDPSYTYLLSDFKPTVKKLKSGRWEIQFTSEIAEGLP